MFGWFSFCFSKVIVVVIDLINDIRRNFNLFVKLKLRGNVFVFWIIVLESLDNKYFYVVVKL